MNSSTRLTSALTFLSSCSVFLFAALALVVPSGYTYGVVFLLLPALAYLFVRPYPKLQTADKYFIATLFSYFFISSASNYFHHLSHSSYDNVSRFLLAIPVLLLLLRFPVKPLYFWAGLACGALGAGIFAVWNFWWQGADRAAGHTNAIQFGDIAMLFSCLLLTAICWAKKYSHWLFALFIAGIGGGIIASLLSGARGGWLALPATALLLYFAFGIHKSVKKTVIIFVLSLLPVAVIYQLPQENFLQSRIHVGLIDLQRYQESHDAETSLGARLHLWQRSLELIQLHPVHGWGTLERAARYLELQGEADGVLVHYNHVHNEFLDSVLKRGVIGGIALFILFFMPAILFYEQWRNASLVYKFIPLAGLTLILCTLTFGLTQTFFSHTSGVMMYVFSLVILWSQTRTQIITFNKP